MALKAENRNKICTDSTKDGILSMKVSKMDVICMRTYLRIPDAGYHAGMAEAKRRQKGWALRYRI